MIKRIGLVVSVCLSVMFCPNAIAGHEQLRAISEQYMSDSSKQKYLDYLKEATSYDNAKYVVLAMAANGCWSTAAGLRKPNAKKMGIENCKKFCKSSCQIYDINGESDFIKKSNSYTSSSSSATSSNSSTTAVGSSTSSSSTSSGSNYDPAIELEYWQTVKDSDDLEMYQAYLESYPNGQFVLLATTRVEELTPKPQSKVDKTKDIEVELEFWKSVRDSDDPDMFQAYLDEYPNGKFAPLARLKIKKLQSSE